MDESTREGVREEHFGDSGYRKNRSARPRPAESPSQGDELLSDRRHWGSAPPRDRDFNGRNGLGEITRLDPVAFQ